MPLERAYRAALYGTALLTVAVLAARPARPAAAVRRENLERAPLDTFLAAPSREAAAQLVDGLIKDGIKFDEAYRALQRGRSYGPAATGVVRLRNKTSDGIEHHY